MDNTNDDELRNTLRQPWIEGQPGVKSARKAVARLETASPPEPKRAESPSAYITRVKGLDPKLVAARAELEKQLRKAAKAYDKATGLSEPT
jgi:hypothetical protein